MPTQKKNRLNWYQQSFNSAAAGSSLKGISALDTYFQDISLGFFSLSVKKQVFAPRKLGALLIIRCEGGTRCHPLLHQLRVCACFEQDVLNPADISTSYAQPVRSSSFVFCSVCCPGHQFCDYSQISPCCHVKVYNKQVPLLTKSSSHGYQLLVCGHVSHLVQNSLFYVSRLSLLKMPYRKARHHCTTFLFVTFTSDG